MSQRRPQFSIATIFLATTLVAIALATAWYLPCLWFVLLFVAPPAGVRAAIVGFYCRRAGMTLTVGDKIELVVESVYATLVAFALALAGGLALWFVITLAPVPDLLAVLLALLAGLVAFVLSLWGSTRPLDTGS